MKIRLNQDRGLKKTHAKKGSKYFVNNLFEPRKSQVISRGNW